jgi:hypothetical protein
MTPSEIGTLQDNTLDLSSLNDNEIKSDMIPYMEELGFLNPDRVVTKKNNQDWEQLNQNEFKEGAFKKTETRSGIREMIENMQQ